MVLKTTTREILGVKSPISLRVITQSGFEIYRNVIWMSMIFKQKDAARNDSDKPKLAEATVLNQDKNKDKAKAKIA